MAQIANLALAKQTDPKEATSVATATEVNDETMPLFLVLGRKGLVDTELRNPHTDEVVYRIRDTGRGSLSNKPDYELYRPGAKDLFVGSIRMGKMKTETNLPLTGVKTKGIEKVKFRYIDGGSTEFTWRTVKSERKVVKDRWFETNDNGHSELMTNTEVIILELVDTSKPDREPICVVRLYNTQPNGRFEIWAKEAWVGAGGDWNALDEMVVSAYANMVAAKKELMSGIDPNSWRGVAYG